MLKPDAHTPCQESQFDFQTAAECKLTRIADAVDPKSIPQTDGNLVHCPAAINKTASLSVRRSAHGILLHYFARCTGEQLIAELQRLWFCLLCHRLHVWPFASIYRCSIDVEATLNLDLPYSIDLRSSQDHPGTKLGQTNGWELGIKC
jgi:hypothetical protein